MSPLCQIWLTDHTVWSSRRSRCGQDGGVRLQTSSCRVGPGDWSAQRTGGHTQTILVPASDWSRRAQGQLPAHRLHLLLPLGTNQLHPAGWRPRHTGRLATQGGSLETLNHVCEVDGVRRDVTILVVKWVKKKRKERSLKAK